MKNSVSVILLILSIQFANCVNGRINTPPQCSPCSCNQTYLHCSNLGLKEIPKFNTAYHYVHADFSFNRISAINKDDFVNFTNVKYINLNTNNISSVATRPFANLLKLKELDLDSTVSRQPCTDCPTTKLILFSHLHHIKVIGRNCVLQGCQPLYCDQDPQDKSAIDFTVDGRAYENSGTGELPNFNYVYVSSKNSHTLKLIIPSAGRTQLRMLRIDCMNASCRETIRSVTNVKPTFCSPTVIIHHHVGRLRLYFSRSCVTSNLQFQIAMNKSAKIGIGLVKTMTGSANDSCSGYAYAFCSTTAHFGSNSQGSKIENLKECRRSCIPGCQITNGTLVTCTSCCSSTFCNFWGIRKNLTFQFHIKGKMPFRCSDSSTQQALQALPLIKEHASNLGMEISIVNKVTTLSMAGGCGMNTTGKWNYPWRLAPDVLKDLVKHFQSSISGSSLGQRYKLMIIPFVCENETTSTTSGTITWPPTRNSWTAFVRCPGGGSGNASRICIYDRAIGRLRWKRPNLSQCSATTTQEQDLKDIESAIQTGNFTSAAQILQEATSKSDNDQVRVTEVVHSLYNIVSNATELTRDVAQPLAGSINNLLSVNQTMKIITEKTGLRFIDSLELFMSRLKLKPNTGSIIKTERASFGYMDTNVDSRNYFRFSVNGNNTTVINTNSTISTSNFVIDVPKSAAGDKSNISFMFLDSSYYFYAAQKRRDLNISTQILSAKIGGSLHTANISDDPVIIKFFVPSVRMNATCVYWNMQTDSMDGSGCNTSLINHLNETTVRCSCDHLTNFALLMDVYSAGEMEHLAITLSVLSYIGVSLSVVGLILTLITHLHFKQLHKEMPGRILICLCFSLLTANVVFLSAGWHRVDDVACKVIGILLHYFYLSTMLWSSVEAFYLYLAIIKVFGTYVSKFLLKASAVSFGVPTVVVAIIIGINRDNYGLRSGLLCFMKYYPFLGGFAIPIAVLMAVNCIIFILVMRKMNKSSKTSKYESAGKHTTRKITSFAQVRGSIGLCVLLGLTWVFAFFAVEKYTATVFQPIFVILHTLQGIFIFLVYCIFKKESLLAWSKYFKFCQRLSDHLNGSGTTSTVTTKTTSDASASFRVNQGFSSSTVDLKLGNCSVISRQDSLNPASEA